MSREDDLSASHISWLVKSRSRNQETALTLYQIMKDNKLAISKNWHLSDVAQGLTACCFSLWRAVFLSDIDEKMASTVTDAETFLGNLILHNMVAYPQDRITRDWTFMYYVNNARYRLEAMTKEEPIILPPGFVNGGKDAKTAKDYWAFFQNAFEIAVRNFEIEIKKKSVKETTPHSK